MPAKIGVRTSGKSLESVPAAQRWAVIDPDTGRRIYLASKTGIDRAQAEKYARSLRRARAVPEGALLDGRFDENLLAEALRASEDTEE